MAMISQLSASSVFSAYASISAFIMLLQTALNQLIPLRLQSYVISAVQRYFHPTPNNASVVIEERDGMCSNEIYSAAETYLCTKIRPNIDRLKISKRDKDTQITVKFAQCEKVPDYFQGMQLEWRFIHEKGKKSSKVMDEATGNIFPDSEKRYFELHFDKQHQERVMEVYVPFVLERAKLMRDEKKVIKLHTLACPASYGPSVMWDFIHLEHPSTFDTLALDPTLKARITQDLDRFVGRQDFYRKVGRAWKRGYLLYGPPGTGKSSLIAAMANYLKFDIYDLELANIRRDSDLRQLLLRTANRSILVIEDIDCSVKLPDRDRKHAPDAHRDQQFTLSGLLNFIDGLWSSCGDQRIIVFTTNNKDKLDPALLRPGRMDVHIHMSYLTTDAFKLLTTTYLGFQDHHPLFSQLLDLIRAIKVTPAQVAEELMKSEDVDTCLSGLLTFLKESNTC